MVAVGYQSKANENHTVKFSLCHKIIINQPNFTEYCLQMHYILQVLMHVHCTPYPNYS